MKAATSPALIYFPVYVGLFAALTLAAICNSFLDIQYGAFGFETLLWSLLFAFTLWLGWRQQGEVNAGGKRAQKLLLIVGLLLTVVVFIPMWRFPRAGLAMLLMLQAAQNCVTVTRRQLYLGLLVSLVAVMFAASHYRADWTMLFYLLPYIVAVVFTLVCEQINRRTDDIRREGLKISAAGGQGAAIVFATTLILLSGALLYSLTPQVSWPNWFWDYGQAGNIGKLGGLPGLQPGQQSNDSGSLNAEQSGGNQGQSAEGDSADEGEGMASAGLSIADMRAAALRPGMPAWQTSSINTLADLAEGVGQVMQPLRLQLRELWEALKAWLQEHQQALVLSLIALLALALLFGAWKFGKELRLTIWLRANLDYLWLVHGCALTGAKPSAAEYYAAMQRLFDLHEHARPVNANAREYLASLSRRFSHLSEDVQAFTQLFEKARYSNQPLTPAELALMATIYRRLFRQADVLNNLDVAVGKRSIIGS